MALSDTIQQLQHLLSQMTKDLSKVVRGNKTAAQRVRTESIRFQKVSKLFRKESLHAEKSSRLKKKKALRKKKK
jgi:hypothetical protein